MSSWRGFTKTPMDTRTVPWLHGVRLPPRGHLPNRHDGEQSSESLSGSMRKFVTPQVWKQVKQAASQHGYRQGFRWTLQPLIMIATMMTWCAGETDADRFVCPKPSTSRFIAPSDSDQAKCSAAFARRCCVCPCPSGGHSAMPCGSRVFHLLSDRMTMEGWFPLGCDGSRMECPRTAELEQSLGKSSKDKSPPTLWVIAMVSLTPGSSGPGAW